MEYFDDNRILINTDDKFPDDISLRNVAILVIFFIKDSKIFYQ